MDRRGFVQALAATGGAWAVGGGNGLAGDVVVGDREAGHAGQQETFSLDFAPHFGMFRAHGGGTPAGELQFMADQGFRALEDNGMRGRSREEQDRIAREMERLGMRMGVFVAHTIYWREANLASGDLAKRDEFLEEIRGSVEVAKRVNATWMTVVPGHVDLRLHPDFQTANVVESLKQAAAILEPHGLVMVLEPLNRRDHPGLFLSGIPQAFQICRAVDSPACKILDDLYHQQITEGNLIPNLDAAWDEIAYFQIGDNPGRREPTTGEINYANVFRHIRDKGYRGILGMEHGNSRSGAEGELEVIRAYRSVDPGG
ncbi:MAG: TIM barrel protein [Gemmatimonadales bacterium]|nr:MAG: TIM barrel protein [Gemmatimonadales bacterium]